MTGAARQDSGFSLIEALVAMTLLAMVGVMASDAIGFGRAAWERLEDRGGRVAEAGVVQAFLRRQIAAARPVLIRTGARQPPVLFEGGPDGLRLVAPLAAQLAPPGDHLIALSLQGGTLGLQVVALGNRPPALTADVPIEPLAEDVSTLRLRYFGPDAEGQQRWQDTWRSRTTLPGLVELRFGWADPDRPIWPPLIIRLPASEARR